MQAVWRVPAAYPVHLMSLSRHRGIERTLFCLSRSSFGNVAGNADSRSPDLACEPKLFFCGKSVCDLIGQLSQIYRTGPDIEFFVRLVHSRAFIENGSPFTSYVSRASRKRSASMAAMQPEPAAVTACRYVESCTSPAAKTPGTLVALPSVVRTYPLASRSTWP